MAAAVQEAWRGHLQFTAYHTIGVWGTGSDDVGLIQGTKAPKIACQARETNVERPLILGFASVGNCPTGVPHL